MRKTDISKYNEDASYTSPSVTVGSVFKEFFALIGKILMTSFLVLIITGIVILISMVFYIMDVANEPLNINLSKMKLSQTSYIRVLNENDEWEDYRQLYSTENRVWVSYKDIPKHMVDAQVAIEDKRFYEHEGVDMKRTAGAVFTLATGGREFGGSTITQQLIKNITDDNEVSVTRKLREIFRALKLEKEYSKDDIIEAYLNIVNYGSGCRGVQSAARLYFNKDIQDCTIAECAAIAGITQNPYAFDPLTFPEKNKERREVVIDQMYEQGKITEAEYKEAVKESENMKFVGYVIEEEDDEPSDWNWYDDRVFRDVSRDLAAELNISVDAAEDMIYNEGLYIYSAMDKKAQEIAEKKVREWKTPNDPTLDVGYMLMDFDGRIFATVGGRQEKDGRLLWDNASQSSLQPGSTIKPLSSYVLALDQKKINYSSLISDTPHANWSANGAGPNNWYLQYYGNITVNRALNISSNAATVSVLDMVGMEASYNFLTKSLGFKHLDEEHDRENLSGLSIGGFYGGVTVEEMTAAYAIFCNGGYYYEPYTYFYVTDNDGNVLLDNRDRGKPDQVISTETSTIMNRLLSDVVNSGGETLGYRAQIDGWDIIGKTGTTDSSFDNWFLGASPYAVSGIWTGHKQPSEIAKEEQSAVHYLWRDIMAEWLKDKASKTYNLGGNVEQHNFIKSSGMLTTYSGGDKIWTGYYTNDNMPAYDTKDPYAKPKPVETSKTENPDDEDSDDEDSGDESSDEESSDASDQSSDDGQSSDQASDIESSTESPDESSDDGSSDDPLPPGESSAEPEVSGDSPPNGAEESSAA